MTYIENTRGAAFRRRRRQKKKVEQEQSWQLFNESINNLSKYSHADMKRITNINHSILSKQNRFLSFTKNAITQSTVTTESSSFSDNLPKSTNNEITNSTQKNITRPSLTKNYRTNVTRVSRYDLPKEIRKDNLHQSYTFTSKNTRLSPPETSVKITRVSSNDNQSITKNKIKHRRKHNSIHVIRKTNKT